MRVIFIDFIPWDYVIDSAYCMPLGGSQSALCYLAEALAALGNEVSLLSNTTAPVLSRGVRCLPIQQTPLTLLKDFDIVIVLSGPAENGIGLRKWMHPGARLILWTGLAPDQPMVTALSNRSVAAAFDAVALVSEWQRQRFQDILRIDHSCSRVLRNAIAPAFVGRFDGARGVLAAKRRPILAYTSTPFRGLDVLLTVFPGIRAQVPDAVLRVYSSMSVYQLNREDDDAKYGHLYRLCRETPGVVYIGSIPQPVLAEQLTDVMLLAYPNHYAETSCISVMEAMACGCQIVTTQLGGLVETTAGFARLVPAPEGNDWSEYAYTFVDQVVAALKVGTLANAEYEQHLADQVEYVNRNYTWPQRAVEWTAWLHELLAARAKPQP